jgi:hypothetical protein
LPFAPPISFKDMGLGELSTIPKGVPQSVGFVSELALLGVRALILLPYYSFCTKDNHSIIAHFKAQKKQ